MIIKDKVFVITGAARGFGFAFAKDLAQAGAKLRGGAVLCRERYFGREGNCPF